MISGTMTAAIVPYNEYPLRLLAQVHAIPQTLNYPSADDMFEFARIGDLEALKQLARVSLVPS